MISVCPICESLYENGGDHLPEPCPSCWRGGWRTDAFGDKWRETKDSKTQARDGSRVEGNSPDHSVGDACVCRRPEHRDATALRLASGRASESAAQGRAGPTQRDMSEREFKAALKKYGMRQVMAWIELPEVNGHKESIGMVAFRGPRGKITVRLRESFGRAYRRLQELEAAPPATEVQS